MIGVGSKVVCVKEQWVPFHQEVTPIVGRVYTVRDVVDTFGGLCFRFTEIRNPAHQYTDDFTECCFLSTCFRPVKKTKTDISIFQEIDRREFAKRRVGA